MYRFGDLTWPDTPAAEGATPMERPVGRLCMHCEEPIGPDDAGFAMPHVYQTSLGVVSSIEPQHECCHIRSAIGSFAHVTEQCSCFVPGSEEHDPPGMTKRQAARLAVFTFFERHAPGRLPS